MYYIRTYITVLACWLARSSLGQVARNHASIVFGIDFRPSQESNSPPMRAKFVTTTNVTYWGTVLGSREGVYVPLLVGCVDEIPNFLLLDLEQAYMGNVVRLRCRGC